MTYITIMLMGKRVRVSKEDYITAKFNDLKDSLRNLTRDTVAAELESILDPEAPSGHPFVNHCIAEDAPQKAEE